ncbi:MAG: M15 family metallopeptidase [Janthinobacterium lividum]
MALALLPYKFGVANDQKIKDLDYWFAVRLQIFLHAVRLILGIQVLVVSGRRTAAQQDALHAADSRNPPAAKGSSHMAGKAVDLNFFRNGVAVLQKATPPAKWAQVYFLAASCGILNGSRFTGYPDNNHFYIT